MSGSSKTRKQKIIILIETCIRKRYTPISFIHNLVPKYASEWMLSERTVKSYKKTMIDMWKKDRWLKIVVESENLMESEKKAWIERFSESQKTDVFDVLDCAHKRERSRNTQSLKMRVYDVLDGFPTSTLEELMDFLDDCQIKKSTVSHYKCEWKRKNTQNSIVPISEGVSVHRSEWFGSVGNLRLDRERAVSVFGWCRTKDRNGVLNSNRALIFPKDGKDVGTLVWYLNGRVKLMLHEGFTNLGYAQALFWRGFASLIADRAVLDECLKHVRPIRNETAFKLSDKRLPYAVITNFKRSNGVVIAMGDRTHPYSVEVKNDIPDVNQPFNEMLKQYASLAITSVSDGKDLFVMSYIC